MFAKSILISVRCVYANKIRRGIKKAELRKAFPSGREGARVYVYVPSPVKEVVGFFYIKQVNVLPILNLWDVAGEGSALTKKEFMAYFSGKSRGISIHFENFVPLCSAVSLDLIREIYPRFHPPQSYIYIDSEIEKLLLGGVLCKKVSLE